MNNSDHSCLHIQDTEFIVDINDSVAMFEHKNRLRPHRVEGAGTYGGWLDCSTAQERRLAGLGNQLRVVGCVHKKDMCICVFEP